MSDHDDAIAKIAAFRRRSYRPIFEASTGQPSDSKLGGAAARGASIVSPCASCGEPLALVLQLNPAQLPEPLRREFGERLLQLFGCAAACEGTDAWVAQAIDTGKGASASEPRAKGGAVIRGWTAQADYPGKAERARLGVALTEAENALLADATCAGDKLSGWSIAAAPPSCPECAKPMRLVFQIGGAGADRPPPVRGVVSLWACASHKSALAVTA